MRDTIATLNGQGEQLTLDESMDWGGCGCMIDFEEDTP